MTPLIKKVGLELINKNYRLVFNLAFLSQPIERTAAVQLVNHLTQNNLIDMFQFSTRKSHNTETTLHKVQHDILLELDTNNAVLYILLDLSAAFDTIDHKVLLNYSVKEGTSWNWFHPRIYNRTQPVTICSSESTLELLKNEVPQGSVLWHILFSISNCVVAEIIQTQYKLSGYAEDGQMYLAFTPKEKPIQHVQAEDSDYQC